MSASNPIRDPKEILVETDSPYLSPEPLSGKSNEPSYITHTIKFLSKIKGLSEENLASITTNNFLNYLN